MCACRDCKVSLGTEPMPVTATLTDQGYWTLCSVDCRVKFLKRWLRVHFEEGAALGAALHVLNCKECRATSCIATLLLGCNCRQLCNVGLHKQTLDIAWSLDGYHAGWQVTKMHVCKVPILSWQFWSVICRQAYCCRRVWQSTPHGSAQCHLCSRWFHALPLFSPVHRQHYLSRSSDKDIPAS